MLSMLLYSNKVALYNLVPGIFAIDLWRHGAADKSMQLLNRIGLCRGSVDTRNLIDGLTDDYGEHVQQWKEQTEKVQTSQ